MKAALEEEHAKRLTIERDLEISTELLNVSIQHSYMYTSILCIYY